MYRAVIPMLFLCVAEQIRLVVGEGEILTTEQVNACKEETKFNGDFNETTPEMKCFFACTMKKAGVMDEKDVSFDMDKMKVIWEDYEDNESDSDDDDDDDSEEFIKNAAEPCAKAVADSSDHCEAAFGFMRCVVKYDHSSRHHVAARDTRTSTIIQTVTWMYIPQ